MASTKTQYTATAPDGKVETRNSKRTYTHASFGQRPQSVRRAEGFTGSSPWVFIGFAGSEELAAKAGNSYRDIYENIAVVAVTS